MARVKALNGSAASAAAVAVVGGDYIGARMVNRDEQGLQTADKPAVNTD